MGSPCFPSLAGGYMLLVTMCPDICLRREAFIGSLEWSPPPAPHLKFHTALLSSVLPQRRPHTHPLASGDPSLVHGLLAGQGHGRKRRHQQAGPSPATFQGAHSADANLMTSSPAKWAQGRLFAGAPFRPSIPLLSHHSSCGDFANLVAQQLPEVR